MNRRTFCKRTAAAVAAGTGLMAPTVLTASGTKAETNQGKLIFNPVYVQKGVGPHLLDWAYASDENQDAFYSDITAGRDGVSISDSGGRSGFSLNVRWNVEGFGYIYITADNGGEGYALPPSGRETVLNLNFELAKSRVMRNRRRIKQLSTTGWSPSHEVASLVDISEYFFGQALKKERFSESCAELSQSALLYAMWTSEKIELDKAWFDIKNQGYRPGFFIGCDARGYYQMDQDIFWDRFTELFNYATVTHYLKSGYFQDFEPQEGKKQFDLRTVIVEKLRQRNITVEGRPLFWFYHSTTPDWLVDKSYDQLLKYVEDHTRKVVSHYGDSIYAWEVVNEMHDWANQVQMTPEQTIELTRLACDVARETNPNVHRLINNCCPFAEYVQLKKWGKIDAKYPQRTPFQFMKDLDEAGVDFTITGQQMYFPYRDLSDTILLIERFQSFKRPVQLTEVGTSSGPTVDSIVNETLPLPDEPYIWHCHWDEELQADWLEGLYTLAYSKPWIEAVNWYDFVDPHSFIKNGGLLRSPKGERKAAFHRLRALKERFKTIAL
jgi:hypothetical protein